MKYLFPIEKISNCKTPFYYYDVELLKKTLQQVKVSSQKFNYHLHYAVKANSNPRILSIISGSGLGADCVSGGEIQVALDAGFSPDTIVFAGVGKADWEIQLGLQHDIFCFNVESIPELQIINTLAGKTGKTASVAIRLIPEVDAHTHRHITTGKKESKFGINLSQLDIVLDMIPLLKNIRLTGIHFHIGSQITDLSVFRQLCNSLNLILKRMALRNIIPDHINVGGGLGINYENPDQHLIPDFQTYFDLFNSHIQLSTNQQLHFEPGRSIVGQCGTLISKVLYVKEGELIKFVVLDAGFTDLIRPILYGAYHQIDNITSKEPVETYDVVGPLCESTDFFGKSIMLNQTRRGDLIAIRSAGAYGEVMASQYNCRQLPSVYFSDQLS